MQNDLISRSALLQSLRDKGWLKGDMTDSAEMIAVQAIIDDTPAVDAVEVVRCKGCNHWLEAIGWCDHHSHFITPDGEACHPWESAEWKMFDDEDYCSNGERRGDDG